MCETYLLTQGNDFLKGPEEKPSRKRVEMQKQVTLDALISVLTDKIRAQGTGWILG